MDAEEARARSAYLRRELKDAIDRTEKLQKAAHKSVNDGITQKVAETITLKVRDGYKKNNKHIHTLDHHWTESVKLIDVE